MKLSVIIPVYNEESTIVEIIERVKALRLKEVNMEIIVVDDGSRDRTPEHLMKIDGIRLVEHGHNRGKGAAVKTGIQEALGDILLIQDGDLEYNPQDYPAILEPILKGECEFVIGSRFQKGGPRFFTENGDPFIAHYIGNLMIIGMTNILYGQSISDYEGCYKAFTRNLAHAFTIEADGFEFDNELMCKAFRRGFKIREVAIEYHPRLYEEGKKIRWQDGMRMLWSILKWRFKRIT